MASSSDREDDSGEDDNGEDDNGEDDGARNGTKRRRVMDDVCVCYDLILILCFARMVDI